MTSRQWIFITIVGLLSLCCVQVQELPTQEKLGTTSHEKGNPFWGELKFRVDDRVPKEYAIRNAPTEISASAEIVKDLAPEPLKREMEFTTFWISKSLRGDIWASEQFRFARKIQNSDDGAFMDLTVTKAGPSPQIIHAGTIHPVVKWHYLVIDARQLTVMIHHAGFSKMEILDIFKDKEIIACPADYHDSITVSEMKDLGDGKSYGKIRVAFHGNPKWFIHPIEWYREGDTVIFLFIKQVIEIPRKGYPPPDKIEGVLPYAAKIIGGIPYDDPRLYLRFKDGNYLDLSVEYFTKWLKDHPRPPIQSGSVR